MYMIIYKMNALEMNTKLEKPLQEIEDTKKNKVKNFWKKLVFH